MSYNLNTYSVTKSSVIIYSFYDIYITFKLFEGFHSCYIFLSSYRSTLYLQYTQLVLRKTNIVIRANTDKYHMRDKRIKLQENIDIFDLLSESYQIEFAV